VHITTRDAIRFPEISPRFTRPTSHPKLQMTVIRSNLNGISIFLQKMKALDKPRRLMPSQRKLDLKK